MRGKEVVLMAAQKRRRRSDRHAWLAEVRAVTALAAVLLKVLEYLGIRL
jgi:hypothetical protein